MMNSLAFLIPLLALLLAISNSHGETKPMLSKRDSFIGQSDLDSIAERNWPLAKASSDNPRLSWSHRWSPYIPENWPLPESGDFTVVAYGYGARQPDATGPEETSKPVLAVWVPIVVSGAIQISSQTFAKEFVSAGHQGVRPLTAEENAILQAINLGSKPWADASMTQRKIWQKTRGPLPAPPLEKIERCDRGGNRKAPRDVLQ